MMQGGKVYFDKDIRAPQYQVIMGIFLHSGISQLLECFMYNNGTNVQVLTDTFIPVSDSWSVSYS